MTTAVPRVRPAVATVAGVAALALVLRSPLVVLAPIAPAARADLGVGAGAYGLLTSVPVLCFAVTTPLALVVLRRLGLERGALVCAAGVAAATLLRSVDGFPTALAATALLGVAITVGNVLVPALVRRDVTAGRRAAATAVFTLSLNLGSVAAAVGGAPLAAAAGWRAASALLAVPAAAVAVAWLLRRPRPASADPAEAGAEPVPRLVAALLALGFCGQSVCFYGFSSWLPTMLHDLDGTGARQAASTASLFQVLGVVGCLAVPALASRLRTWQVALAVGVCWTALPAGLLAGLPAVPLLVIGGIAQGAGLTAVLSAVAASGATAAETARLSAVVQGAGYTVAAASPAVLGARRDASGSWMPALAVLTVAALVYLLAATGGPLLAARTAAV